MEQDLKQKVGLALEMVDGRGEVGVER